MPIRTRQDMHIGLDVGLEVLNSTPMNRMDAPVKDFFLNRTISEFVKKVVDKANKPDESKRVPLRLLSHGDILSKYNDIYTLIKIATLSLVETDAATKSELYTLPTDMFRFEASYSSVRPITCDTNPYKEIPNLLPQTYDIAAFNDNPYGGGGKYMATILESTGLRVYHLGRYTLENTSAIYIKNPAVLTSSPQVVNCDLPSSVHDEIIDNTVKFIAAAVASGNYEQLLMEAKEVNK